MITLRYVLILVVLALVASRPALTYVKLAETPTNTIWHLPRTETVS